MIRRPDPRHRIRATAFMALILASLLVSSTVLVRSQSPQVGASTERDEPFSAIKKARGYRAGFANGTHDYDSLLIGWQGNGKYDNREVLRSALDRLAAVNRTRPANSRPDEATSRGIAEAVNEILQGQMIEGNQSLLDALRARFPRTAGAAPATPKPKLAPPLGNTRPELEPLDRSIEAFGLGVRAALFALGLRDGDTLLRAAGRSEGDFDGFPQFTKIDRPFYEDSQNSKGEDGKYPLQVEFSLLSRVSDRMAQASIEKARKLFNMSSIKGKEATRDEAVNALKQGAHRAYVIAVALGAAQTEQQFQDNGGPLQLAHTSMAREFFTRIRSGVTPFGNAKTFVPGGKLETYIGRAQTSIVDAKNAQGEAEREQQRFEDSKTLLAEEKKGHRGMFLTPLTLLTGLDPAVDSVIDVDRDGRFGEKEPKDQDEDKDGRKGEHESFDGLETIRGRELYRTVVMDRVRALVETDHVPGTTTSQVGTLGTRILALKDAQLAGEQAYNALNNIPRKIANIQQEAGAINAATEGGANEIAVVLLAEAAANQIRVNSGTKGAPPSPFFEVSFDPGAITRGLSQGGQVKLQSMTSIRINNIKAEAEVKSLLLQQENAVIDVRRAKVGFDKEMTALELDYRQMDQFIADFAESHAADQDLWYRDPTNRVKLSRKMRQANLTLEEAIVALYQLARALEYEWNEEYRNPAIIPPDVQGVAPTLGQGGYDRFTQTEDVFTIERIEEAENFQAALKEWDHKMREIGTNVIAVRGPIRGQRLTNRTILYRDDLLGLDNRLTRSTLTEEEKVEAFRRHLKERLLRGASPLPGLELTFGLDLDSPADIQPLLPFKKQWNLRVVGVTIETVADSGYSRRNSPDCVFYLTQAGMVSTQTFFDSAEKLKERNITRYWVPVVPDRPERSVFRSLVPSKVNNHSDPNVPSYHREIEGERPIAASHWQLTLDPDYPRNFGLDVEKLRDIRITFEYVDGNPREFSSWRSPAGGDR